MAGTEQWSPLWQMHALQSRTHFDPAWTLEMVPFYTSGLSHWSWGTSGNGCKMPLVLSLSFKRTYPNESESYVCKEVNNLQTLTFITK